jgi:hypothetical protein
MMSGRSYGCAKLALMTVAVAATLLVPGTAEAATSWTLQQLPVPAGIASPVLDGVSCPSATACMVVGFGGAAGGGFTDSWDGTNWTAITIPGSAQTTLTSVSCTSVTFCEAAGYKPHGADYLPVALRWNGTSWRTQSTPLPAGVIQGALGGVSCVSRSSCVAVGESFGALSTFSETWNGTAWTPSRMPGTRPQYEGVSCASSTSCFAVSGLTVAFWNGATWTAQTLPPPSPGEVASLSAVSCSSAAACTAVGSYDTNGRPYELIYRWNGATWTQQTGAVPNHSTDMYGLWCGPVACTAVGEQGIHHIHNEVLAERWNGTAWAKAAGIVVPAGTILSELYGVSCHTQRDCMAVGYFQSSTGSVPIAEQKS